VTGSNIRDNGQYAFYAAACTDAAITFGATGNWWGTVDTLEIEAVVYHRVDASSSPFVDFVPCAESPFTVETLGNCACDCHADPSGCDGAVDVIDVVLAVNVAFRNFPDQADPNLHCLYTPTDVDCDGATGVLDVVRFVNVAFRNFDAETEFCDTCGD
jgi:hypothetical protein